jgi:hypothetical protein
MYIKVIPTGVLHNLYSSPNIVFVVVVVGGGDGK